MHSFATALFLGLACGVPCADEPSYSPRTLDPEEAAEDVRIFADALRRIHPGLDRYASPEAMDQLLERLARDVEGGTTDESLYLRVSNVLARIRCDHTKAELPPALVEHRNRVPSYLPFSFRLFGTRMFVDRTDATQEGLARGDEVVAVNGRSVTTLVETLGAYVPVDGWTDPSRFVELQDSNEFLGDAIDHFLPLRFGWSERFELDVLHRVSGERERVVLEPVTYPRWVAIAHAEGSDGSFPDSVDVRRLDEETAYLRIGTFVNYRNPVDPRVVLGPTFDELREDGVAHLVLDLRGNGGGSTDVPTALLRYLLREPFELGRPSWVRTSRFEGLREHLSTWQEGALDVPSRFFRPLPGGWYEVDPALDGGGAGPIEPYEDRFDGEVSVLIGPANASGATNLLAKLKDARPDIRMIGGQTGGSAEGPTAGLILFLKLPHSGITVRIPALRQWNAIATFVPGMGVEPDLVIEETVEDWLGGRDVVLEAALQGR